MAILPSDVDIDYDFDTEAHTQKHDALHRMTRSLPLRNAGRSPGKSTPTMISVLGLRLPFPLQLR